MLNVFVAYATGNDFQETIIKDAAKAASNSHRTVTPWSSLDTSGTAIYRSVEGWIDLCDAFVADVSVVNDNVTYEIGYAIGQQKPIRLIRSNKFPFAPVKSIGLIDTLGHDSYEFQNSLCQILSKTDEAHRWPSVSKNREQPIFILQPPEFTDASARVVSAVKKIARMKFRGFNPTEISRLNATEAYEYASASSGVIAFWMEGQSESARQNNQRAAFIFGIARGLGVTALLIAHTTTKLPLDFNDTANRWDRFDDLDEIINNFRLPVADAINDLAANRTQSSSGRLESINFGDPVAENEASLLHDFFLETEGYRRTLNGESTVLVGRKGSGKSAVFLQVRDRCRADKNNIVVDLMPDGYQLIKLKEYIINKVTFGTRKEVIAAFWEYILWLEIAYKILEKDKLRSRNDSDLLRRYEDLESLFISRVDTGIGDFSERLRLLSENLIERFEERVSRKGSSDLLSSDVLEIVYGQDIGRIRDVILGYLKQKGFVLFLFDNLDRIWTPGGFTDDDATILVGLIEAMQEISKKFSKKKLDLRWAIFVRSDVYEFLVHGMADYGKLTVQSLEWSDREQLHALFNQRLIANLSGDALPATWSTLSVQLVRGQPVMDFLIDGSMMRPRYLIRLFETARRRALTIGRNRIIEDDYEFALVELGWQVLEDLDREVSDLVVEGKNFLWQLIEHRDGLTPDKLRYLAKGKIEGDDQIDRLIDVLIWNGSVGLKSGNATKFIFDCGYKRQYLASIISSNPSAELVLHPTLCAAVR